MKLLKDLKKKLLFGILPKCKVNGYDIVATCVIHLILIKMNICVIENKFF
jgi:hypothetical protein